MEPDTNVPSSQPSSDQGEDRQTSEEQTTDGGVKGIARSRKRTKHGRYISEITLAEVQKYTYLPAHVACEKLGLGLTSFKRVCRSLGINNWPYRKDSSSALPPENSNGFGSGSGSFVRQQSLNSGQQAAMPVLPPPSTQIPSPESPLQALLREATPDSLLALLEKVRELSREMRQTLGLSVIDDNAVDLLHYVLTRLKEAHQMEQQRQVAAAAMATAAAGGGGENNPIVILAALAQAMLGGGTNLGAENTTTTTTTTTTNNNNE